MNIKGTLLAGMLALLVFSPHMRVEAAGLGQCGSSWKQRLGVPDYVCVTKGGSSKPYAACAVGALVGAKPVYFCAACEGHDRCYARKGSKKSTCDANFGDLLSDTCSETLTGRSWNKGLSKCKFIAAGFEAAVAVKGCTAFIAAQKAAGVKSPKCR